MPFGRDTRVVPRNTALDRGPGPPMGRGDLGLEPPVCSDATYCQITLVLARLCQHPIFALDPDVVSNNSGTAAHSSVLESDVDLSPNADSSTTRTRTPSEAGEHYKPQATNTTQTSQ